MAWNSTFNSIWAWFTGHDHNAEQIISANTEEADGIYADVSNIMDNDLLNAREDILGAIREFNNINGLSQSNINFDTDVINQLFDEIYQQFKTIRDTFGENVSDIVKYAETGLGWKIFAGLGVGLAKVTEGILSVPGEIIDAGASLVGKVMSAAGANTTGIENFIKKEWIHDFFSDEYEAIDEYSIIKEDSKAAGAFELTGKVLGYVATGNILAEAGSAMTAAEGAGKFATATGNLLMNETKAQTLLAGVTGLGNGTEDALNEGLSMGQAFNEGIKEGATDAAIAYGVGKLVEFGAAKSAKKAADEADDAFRAAIEDSGDDTLKQSLENLDDAERGLQEAEKGVKTAEKAAKKAKPKFKKTSAEYEQLQKEVDAAKDLEKTALKDLTTAEQKLADTVNSLGDDTLKGALEARTAAKGISQNAAATLKGKTIDNTAYKALKESGELGKGVLKDTFNVINSTTTSKTLVEAVTARETIKGLTNINNEASNVPTESLSDKLLGKKPLGDLKDATKNIKPVEVNYQTLNDNGNNTPGSSNGPSQTPGSDKTPSPDKTPLPDDDGSSPSSDDGNTPTTTTPDPKTTTSPTTTTTPEYTDPDPTYTPETVKVDPTIDPLTTTDTPTTTSPTTTTTTPTPKTTTTTTPEYTEPTPTYTTTPQSVTTTVTPQSYTPSSYTPSSSNDYTYHSDGGYSDTDGYVSTVDIPNDPTTDSTIDPNLNSIITPDESPIGENLDFENIIDGSATSIDKVVGDNDYTQIPTSPTQVTPSPVRKTSGSSVIPIAAGLSAAAAAGIGAKAYLDHKRNNDNGEDDEDEYSDEFETEEWNDGNSLEIQYDDAPEVKEQYLDDDDNIISEEESYEEEPEKYGARSNQELADLQ